MRSADPTSEGCFVNELIIHIKCQTDVLHTASAQQVADAGVVTNAQYVPIIPRGGTQRRL